MNEQINVLQILDHCAVRGSPIHGVTRLLLNWFAEFKRANIHASVCVLRGSEGTSELSKLDVPLDVLNRSKLDPRTISDIIKIIKKRKIQVLHCHGYGASTFGRIVGVITACPVVVHEHMIDPDIPYYQRLPDKILSSRTAKAVGVSYAVKKFMEDVRYFPVKETSVIHNCIPSVFCDEVSVEQKLSCVKKYNIPQNKLIVGIVGRLDALKAHSDYLRAASAVLAVMPETYFLIVGDGELKLELEALTRQLDIQDSVQFLGHCDNVKEIISLLDLFVLCSLTEGFAISIIEAMALGVPVVATSVGGVPEIIADGETGFLVPPKSPDKLAEKIIKLLGDENLRNNLSVKGSLHCKENYLAPVAVEKLSKLYNDVL